MSIPVTPNLYEMPMEELAALALAEPTAEPTEPEASITNGQPRNADGTFAAVPPQVDDVVPPQVNAVAPPAPQVFRRVIDLGDGSGVQVFEASSPELLIDKLADAQMHATRKIRSLTQAQKEEQQPVEKKKLTADEEWVLAQQLQTNPSEVLERMIAERLASSPELQEARQIAQKAKNDAAAQAWVVTTSDYFANEYNGRKMTDYINRFCNGQQNPENLTKAFADLNGAGLLQSKPADPAPAPVAPAAPAPVVPAPVPRRSSGLSARAAALAPTTSGELSIEDAYNMPMDKLYELAQKQARGQ
jgi:hypothetical protein